MDMDIKGGTTSTQEAMEEVRRDLSFCKGNTRSKAHW